MTFTLLQSLLPQVTANNQIIYQLSYIWMDIIAIEFVKFWTTVAKHHMNAPSYLAPFCNIFVVFQMNMERLLKVQFTKCTVLQQFDMENVQCTWEPICCKILRNIWWVWNWHRSYTSNVDLCENLPNIYLQNGFSDILRINEIYKCGPWGDVTTLNIRAHGDH